MWNGIDIFWKRYLGGADDVFIRFNDFELKKKNNAISTAFIVEII